MATLAEIRKKYPQYADMPDEDLARALHGKYYSDLEFEEFSKQIGLKPPPTTSKVGAYTKAIGQGVSFGLADELGAGARMAEERDLPLSQQSMVNPFQEQLDLSRKSLDTSRQEYPDVFNSVVPVAAATMASAAFPPAAAGSLLARFGPGVLAAATGGGIGGASEESARPGSTAGSIALEGLKSGAEMGVAEVAGLGLGAAANRLLAPRLRFMDPLKGVRERIKGPLGAAMERVKAGIPQGVKDLRAVRILGDVANSHLGTEMMEAVVPATTAVFGPLAGGSVWLGKQVISPPGPIARYLSRSTLPSQGIRRAGRQTTTTALRSLLGYSEEEDRED
jgi:hypothetical protein